VHRTTTKQFSQQMTINTVLERQSLKFYRQLIENSCRDRKLCIIKTRFKIKEKR